MSRLEIMFRPLEGWPRTLTPDEERRRSAFKSHSIDANMALLKRELKLIGATIAVIQSAHAERDISATTGRPRPDRRPEHPGVIVAADTKFGAVKWVCDDCTNWPDNIRAIALTLERLRLAERYGVTKRGEQYLGFKMLPGPITAPVGPPVKHMSIQAAADLMGRVAEVPPAKLLKSRGIYEAAFRDAAKKLHPDAGGSEPRWRELQDAKIVLDSFHSKR